MEETLPIDYTGSETDDEISGPVMAAVGCLKVIARDGEKERCYPVFKGVNSVGRSTSCQICIPVKAISKHHATILVEKDSHFLQDNNSKNHTRRNKVLLRPQTYYELSDKCDLLFGDCSCIYYTGKEQWEGFVARRDDDSQTLCETVAMTSSEEPLPVTPVTHDRHVIRSSCDVTDALFSPDEVADKRTVPVTTEQTQLLFTADADGTAVTNGSDSRSSSPLLAEQDHEATQLIPIAEIAATEHNETEANEEATIAYPIAPTTTSPSHSPVMDGDDDIDATIPYDMTQGFNLLNKGRGSASNSPDADIENTIPYEMTQGMVGSNLTESPTTKHSPIDDVEPTIPYEMPEASPTGSDPAVGVAEPTVGVAEPMVGMADPTACRDEPAEGVAEPTIHVDEPTVGVVDQTVNVDDPTVHIDEPAVGVAEPTVHVDEPTVGVADPTVHVDEPAMDLAKPMVGVSEPAAADLDETQSIDDNDPTIAVMHPAVGVADAMDDDDDATQSVDPAVGVAEMDTGDASTTTDQQMDTRDEKFVDHSDNSAHVPPAVSPTHLSPRTSPINKTTPILKNVMSPKSPTSKKVHFESAKPATLHLSTPLPSGSGTTVSLDDEESPDVELPAKTLLEPHPPLSNDKTATTTAANTRGGAKRKGKTKTETTSGAKTRSSSAEKDKAVSNKKAPAETKRGGARNKSAGSSTKTEDTTSSKEKRSATESTKDKRNTARRSAEGNATTGTSTGKSTAKGKTASDKGKAQPSRRGGKRKVAAELSTDSDETPSVTPITTPVNESPSFLTDADALFSGGGRIKRKYTDFLSTPKRDHLLRREESLNIELSSVKSSSSSSNDLLSIPQDDLPAASRDSPIVSHDPPVVSHDSATASHDTLPKVLFTGIVDEDGQKVVKELGGELVESVFDCTHLVTDDKLRRTLKLLCCISRGCPIVSTQWLKKCKQQKKFVSAEPFIIKDRTFEKQRKCSLSASLAKARTGPPLLQNQQFFITGNVQPAPSDMSDIIKCSGGEVLDHMPLVGSDTVSIITCDADLSTCKAASEGGVSLYSSEYLLSGILRQQMDPVSHCLVVKEEERPNKNKRRASSSNETSSTKRRRK